MIALIRYLPVGLLLLSCLLLAGPESVWAAVAPERSLGARLPVWSVIPFAGILLSIAFLPLTTPRFWHRHFGKISACWALLFAGPFLWGYGGEACIELSHILLMDYLPFVIMLWGLFTISGGIVIRGTLPGTPLGNTALLLAGTLLASCVGTTGASMLLIRPVLRANQQRVRKAHIVCFFIFLVSNIGGALTPLGDPPLFLGFLHNVPFFWVTKALLPQFLFVTVLLLCIFYGVDYYHYRRERMLDPQEAPRAGFAIRIEGAHNFLLLGGVVGAILLSGSWKPQPLHLPGIDLPWQNIVRDGVIVILGLLSLKTTARSLRKENSFGWGPMLEVAKLFAAIFVTILPALAILKAGMAGPLASLVHLVQTPAVYFWVSGGLSSFLDNAPTYLTFFNMALGNAGLAEAQISAALSSGTALTNVAFIGCLQAISAGAVFMGANSYLGNAPNFMVKFMAEEAGVRMPSFFGYLLKYTFPVLVPVFVIVAVLFY